MFKKNDVVCVFFGGEDWFTESSPAKIISTPKYKFGYWVVEHNNRKFLFPAQETVIISTNC